MTDRAYIVSRTLENKIAIAENNDQNTLLVTLDVLKEILSILKEQQQQIWEFQDQAEYLTYKLNEQKAVKPRVSSVEQRCGNCNKVIEMDG